MFYVQRRERDGINGQYLGLLIMLSPPTRCLHMRVT